VPGETSLCRVPGVALLLWLVFGLFALGGRILLQLRRHGSSGVVGVSGTPGSIEWWGGLLFVAALAAGGAAPVLELTDVVDPIEAFDANAVQAAGLVLYALGLAVCVGAQLAMGASWRIGVDKSERTDLVTDGPFAIVRNPIYSGVIPLVAGLTLLAPNPVAIAAFVVLVAAFEIQVRLVEEPYLLRAHGDAYREYASRVGRFVPGLGLLRRAR
jgi:protein-S-isoprenylcysteine O-methyltransferase Ste14